MSKPPTESDRFRRKATAVYTFVSVAIIALVIAAASAGWHFWAWPGLLIVGAIALVIGTAAYFAATLLWAMTQDGA